MKDRHRLGKIGVLVRWTARVLSLVVGGFFLLVLVLAIFGEDRARPSAIPVLVLLGLTIAACLAAWRWERAGGIAIIIGAVALSVVISIPATTYWVGPRFLPALIYGLPFLVVGALFWVAGQSSPGTA